MILHLGNNTLAVGKMWVAGKDVWGVGAQEGGPPRRVGTGFQTCLQG